MTEDTQQPTPGSEPASTPAPGTPTSDAVAAVTARIAELETALAAERDNALRKAAEFDNIRKRLVADAKRQSEAGKLGFIQQVLAIADTLEVALTTPADKDTVEHVRQGVELTLNKLRQLLGEHGVTRYESLGEPFDPDRHEALSMGKNPELPDQAVIQVFREGYARGDHILRHAQVIINDLS
jgi:molecular chaperone GrpE